jgi:predicted ribosome quality control (RQC) complex YloA/Tae2 family protein
MTEQTDTEEDDNLSAIKNKLSQKQHKHSELHINRVPDKAIEELKDLAYRKFAGDYGATLSYLLEIHDLTDKFSTKQQQMMEKIKELEMYIQEIEEEDAEEKTEDKIDTLG